MADSHNPEQDTFHRKISNFTNGDIFEIVSSQSDEKM